MEVRRWWTTMVADDDGGRWRRHAWLGGRLRWGRIRAGSERRQRQQSGDDGCGSSGQQLRRQTTTAADSNGMQDWAATYEGDGQERAARDGGDTEWQWRLRRWKIAGVDNDSGGRWQRRRRTTTTATADGNSSEQRQRRTTTACKIGRRTTRGTEESRRQTTTALEPAGQRAWKNKEIEFTQKDFFQRYGLSGWIFCSRRNTQWYLLDLSVLFVVERKFSTTSAFRIERFKNLQEAINILRIMKFSLIISVMGTHACYHHVVVIWRDDNWLWIQVYLFIYQWFFEANLWCQYYLCLN